MWIPTGGRVVTAYISGKLQWARIETNGTDIRLVRE